MIDIATTPGRVRRSLKHLSNCRGFETLDPDSDGPRVVRVWSKSGPIRWKRVTGRLETAIFEQEEPA